MAVYEGARPRSGFFPRGRAGSPPLRRPVVHPPVSRRAAPVERLDTPALPRRRARTAIRARRHPRTVGFVLGAIVVVFLLSFFSLVQTVRVSASGYDLDRLDSDYANLLRQRQQVMSDLDRYGAEPAIRQEAISDGLTQLPPPIVIPAR